MSDNEKSDNEGSDPETREEEDPEVQYKDRLKRWLDEKWGKENTCPVCKHNEWGTFDLIGLDSYLAATREKDGFFYPVIPIVCFNCGFMRLFSAVITEAIPRDKPEAKGGDSTPGVTE